MDSWTRQATPSASRSLSWILVGARRSGLGLNRWARPASQNTLYESAIDLDCRTGEIAGSIGQKERADTTELGRISVPAQRYRANRFGFGVSGRNPLLLAVDLVELADTIGVEPARHDRIDPDSRCRELQRQRLGESRHRRTKH